MDPARLLRAGGGGPERAPYACMITRRRFLWAGAVAGAGTYLTSKLGARPRLFAQVPGATLSPASIPKFVRPLFIPPAMPRAAVDTTTDHYAIGIRQFRQQILPPPLDRTTVWGYGSLTDPRTFHYPSPSFEARAARAVRVKWLTQLGDSNVTRLR